MRDVTVKIFVQIVAFLLGWTDPKVASGKRRRLAALEIFGERLGFSSLYIIDGLTEVDCTSVGI